MLGRTRDVARKARGPGFGLAAGLVAFWLGADVLLAVCVAIFVGVLAWMRGNRLSAADRRHDGYGHHPVGGWMAGGDMGAGGGFDGGGFDGGGGDGGGGDGGGG